jgi:hypothetical protein
MATKSKLFAGDKYENKGSNLFPSDDISPMSKRKGDSAKQFALQFAKAFYSGWGTGIFAYSRFSERDQLIQLRNYSRGRQAEEIYQEFIYGRNDQNEIIKKGYMNVNWDILKIALQYKDGFISKLNEWDYDPVISSQDQYARDERKERMMVDYVKNKMKGIFQANPGMDENTMAPDSIAEFEILEQMGVYKNKAEYAWEKYINNVFNGFNRWDLKLKNKLLDDIFTLGRLCVRDYVDPETQTVKTQYIDPLNLIIRLTTDGEVIDGGFIDLMTVQDLKKASGLPEEELFAIAQNACGWYGNPDKSRWNYGTSYEAYLQQNAVSRGSLGNCEWYAFRVPVLKCEYRSVDTEYYTEQQTQNGTKYSRGKYGKTFTKSPTRKTIKKDTINYYTCSWIVGTDYCYDYGLQYDMPRTERAEARCSFHYYQMDDPSIVERCKPVFDNVQLAWLNFQNGIAKSRPDGNLYDLSALVNANVGDKIKPYDIIKGINETGSGFWNSMNKRKDRPVQAPNSGPPVIPMKGGYQGALEDFVGAWNSMSMMLSSLSGMNPSFIGSSTGLPEGARVNEGQMAASVSLLKPKIDAYFFVKSSCALNILLRGQVIFRHNDKISEEYKNILGPDIVQILKTASEKNYSQYGLKMTLRISGALKEDVKGAAVAALQAGRNGQPGLTFMEYFKILDMLESNVEIKYIQGFMQRLIDKREGQMQKMQQENADNQNKGLMQLEQQKAAGQMELLKFTTDLEIQKGVILEAAKAYYAIEQMKEQGNQDITGSSLDLIMQTAMQQYASTMAPQTQGQA